MAGESLGGETQPYLQVLPSPYLSLWSGCHWQPLVPLEACPALILPMPSTARRLAPISTLGQGKWGKSGPAEAG